MVKALKGYIAPRSPEELTARYAQGERMLHLTRLRGADLSAMKLSGANLSYSDLQQVTACSTDLTGANLSHTDLQNAVLTDAHLDSADLTGANLRGADLSRATLLHADLKAAHFDKRTRWPEGFNPSANGTIGPNVNLSGANLAGENLKMAELSWARLDGAMIAGADLVMAHLEGASLIGANLNDAHLQGADLVAANLSSATLSGADLRGADLRGAVLTATQLTNARFDTKTQWPQRFDYRNSGAVGPSANLTRAAFAGIDLRMTDLSRATLIDADLQGAELIMTNLNRAVLTGANLAGADLRRADLRGANLSSAILKEVNLTRALYDTQTRWPAHFEFSTQDAFGPGSELANADLSGVRLVGTTLSGANLAGANLHDCNLTDANLSGANLCGANLCGANLCGANLSGANLDRATINLARYDHNTIWPDEGANPYAGAIGPNASLNGADLRGANLAGANLAGANLDGATLSHASLEKSLLFEATLAGTNLDGANLAGASLHGATLTEASLERANLTRAILSNAELQQASLQHANLSQALLFEANLRNADLSHSNLQRAQFLRSDLGQTNLSNADISGVDLRWAFLAGANLSEAQGLPQNRERCLITWETLKQSQWTREELREWQAAGAAIGDLNAFPEELREELLGLRQGLTLLFSGELSTFEDYLLRSVILSVLGTNTDCHISRVRVRNTYTEVLIEASQMPDLEWIAEVLHQRAWELPLPPMDQSYLQRPELLQPLPLRDGLSLLIDDKLSHAELFAPDNQGQHRRTWTFARHLDPILLRAVQQATSTATLNINRETLLIGINEELLTLLARSSDSARRDLACLNRASPLHGGKRPLMTWLENAKQLSNAPVFERALLALKDAEYQKLQLQQQP